MKKTMLTGLIIGLMGCAPSYSVRTSLTLTDDGATYSRSGRLLGSDSAIVSAFAQSVLNAQRLKAQQDSILTAAYIKMMEKECASGLQRGIIINESGQNIKVRIEADKTINLCPEQTATAWLIAGKESVIIVYYLDEKGRVQKTYSEIVVADGVRGQYAIGLELYDWTYRVKRRW